MGPTETSTKPSFVEALALWGKIGVLSFGGPAGQIALMHRLLVEEHRWIAPGPFLHALNFCMLLPGPEAQQLATYIGWTQHGIRGAIAAGTLFVLPGFCVIVALAIAATTFGELPAVAAILYGLQAATIAIVADALWRLSQRALKGSFAPFLAIAAFVALWFFDVPFPFVIAAAAVVGAVAFGRRTARGAPDAPTTPAARTSGLRVLLTCLALWFIPVALLAATLGPTHRIVEEATFFSRMAVVTFGGAYAVLTYVAQQVVEMYGWLDATQMVQALALAETTPGPLILVLTYVGFVAAHGAPAPFSPLLAGVLGAVVTTWVTFVQCFLWVLLGAPHLDRIAANPRLSGALRGITAAVVGVISNLSLWFAAHVLFPGGDAFDARAAVIATLAFIALRGLKLGLLPVLAGAALAGFIPAF
jgi:chromate transporter